jgi:predicted Zn-dependent peptidase
MVRGRTVFASVLGAALAAAPGIGTAATGELPNLGPHVDVARMPSGATTIVQRLSGAPVAAIELWYRAPATGFGPKPRPSLARLAAQVVAASKPLVGEALGPLVKSSGGRLAITVYADSLEIAAVVPLDAARAVVKTMTTVYFAPVLTDTGFRIAQRDVAQEALLEGFNPETIARDAVFASLFSNEPQHSPALGSPQDVAALTIDDARAYATRAFRSQNAVLVVSGAVDPSIVTAAVAGRPATGDLAQTEQHATAQVVSAPDPVQRVFDEPSGGYGWIGPPIAAEREATALDFIADYLFGGDTGYVTHALAVSNPDAFVVGQFITLYDPGVLFVGYSGKQPDALRAKIDEGVGIVRKPLPPATFAAAVVAFRYHLLRDLQTPAELADNFGWYTVEGNPEYAPGVNGAQGKYFAAVDSLTPDFVAAVAEKYLGHPAAMVTLRPAPPKAPAPAPSPQATP